MREYRFSLTRVFLYKDRIYDFVLIQENTGQWKPIYAAMINQKIETVANKYGVYVYKELK